MLVLQTISTEYRSQHWLLVGGVLVQYELSVDQVTADMHVLTNTMVNMSVVSYFYKDWKLIKNLLTADALLIVST